jgi:hypothetical protein
MLDSERKEVLDVCTITLEARELTEKGDDRVLRRTLRAVSANSLRTLASLANAHVRS